MILTVMSDLRGGSSGGSVSKFVVPKRWESITPKNKVDEHGPPAPSGKVACSLPRFFFERPRLPLITFESAAKLDQKTLEKPSRTTTKPM